MFGGASNLPPGCSINDIPGNRPEDEREDRFWEALDEKLKDDPDARSLIDGQSRHVERLVQAIRDLSYGLGFDEGRAEEQMAQAYAEMERTERANLRKEHGR